MKIVFIQPHKKENQRVLFIVIEIIYSVNIYSEETKKKMQKDISVYQTRVNDKVIISTKQTKKKQNIFKNQINRRFLKCFQNYYHYMYIYFNYHNGQNNSNILNTEKIHTEKKNKHKNSKNSLRKL